tara:strand:+ start:76 stop:243 length:168 start_codon:yes stop_codon:yes gene_type:complete
MRIKEFWIECIRVLKVTKKPNQDEFKTISKVAGLGMLAIGLLGFLIFMIDQILFK